MLFKLCLLLELPADWILQQALKKVQTILVNVTIIHLIQIIFQFTKCMSFKGFGGISDELEIELVNDATVEPSMVSLFNHPDNKEFVVVSFTIPQQYCQLVFINMDYLTQHLDL